MLRSFCRYVVSVNQAQCRYICHYIAIMLP